MELEFLLLVSTIIFFASLIHGSIGFGFPMIATPLIALYTDLQTAIIYTLIPTLLVNIITIFSEGGLKEAFKQFWPLAIYAGVGSILGTLLLINFNSEVLKLLLAFAILSYLVLDMVKIEILWIRKKAKFSQALFGTFAGLLGGLTNAMAPILIIYTLESKFSKKQIIQASNICFFVGKIVQIVLFATVSAFSFKELSISLISLLVSALALLLGVRLKKSINPILYKKFIKLLLFSIAIILFVKYFY